MEQIKKNFGFGCMRLPMNGENIDMAETCRMVDAFLDAGFNYFDTARGYLQGKSELALRECLTSRYPRERYILTDKLTAAFFKTEEHISFPDLFATMNTKQIHHDWNADYYYNVVHTAPAAGRPTASSADGARRSVPSTCPSAVFWRTWQKNLKRKRTDMKALIAFYSRAGENYFGGAYRRISVGNTEQAARMLAAVTGADTLRIEQVQPYSEDYKACVADAREDWQCGARPALVNLPESLDGYDEIYLGYPNYCGTMPMAVYTFLEHYDFTGKTIRPFCTHEGSGLSDTESDIRRAAPGAAVTKGLAIHGSHVAEAESALARWVREGK